MSRDAINIMFIVVGELFILNLFFLESSQIGAVKFDPIPFDKIPVAKINSNNGEYKIRAHFSIDYGDEPVVKSSNDSNMAKNMILNKHDKGLSLQLDCDINDICGTSLAPSYVTIYLVNSNVSSGQIVNSSVVNVELGYNDCGIGSIKNCANFDFSIPGNVTEQNYNLVLDMSFDEAQWLFINPVKILD